MSTNSNKKKDIMQWVEVSTYDIETAKAMQKAGRYLYVLFCCQQAIEKRLKALVVNTTENFPPKSHDLVMLAELAKAGLDPRQKLFLRKLNNYYIETRYPEETREISKKVTRTLSKLYLTETEEMIKCLDRQLK